MSLRQVVGPILRKVEHAWPVWLALKIDRDPIVEGLLAIHKKRGPQSFFQLGSNDGITGDPLYRFVLWHRWHGVTVEPVPSTFERLSHNYRWTKRVKSVQAAVGQVSGTRTLYVIAGRHEEDPEWVDQVASFDHEHVLRHARTLASLEERIISMNVKVMSVGDLWSWAGKERVDFLHVDIEGEDARVLLSAPLKEMGVSSVLYEYIHLHPDEDSELTALFDRLGFVTSVETNLDRLIVSAS